MNQLTPNLPFADYLKLPGLSASSLKKLARSPLAYKWALDHPDTTPSASMVLGSAVHTAILEPERMRTDYVLWDGGTRRGKAWDAFEAENESKVILTATEFDTVKAMRRSVLTHEPAVRYLEAGTPEVSMQWEMAGRQFKGRIDWLTVIDGQPVIADLKTTRDARPYKFGADAFNLGYHIQFALYCDGFAALHGGQVPRFVVICVENGAPYEPAVFDIPEDVIEHGREEYMRLVTLLDECEASGTWPPACETEQALALPSWAYTKTDDDVTGLGLIA